MRASAREGNKHAREQFFLTICGGGDLTICILLPASPPSATRTKISCSRAYFYPPGRLPFLTVIKRVRICSRRQYANILAPIRPSAVRNSNKNLLLSGVFLPSRALAFSDSYKKGSYISSAAVCQYLCTELRLRPCNIIRKSLALGRVFTLSGACLF